MRVTLIDNFQLVPEEIIELCASQLEGEENNFRKMLDRGREFREAGLTPIFLCSNTLQDLMVTTAEKLQKKLH